MTQSDGGPAFPQMSNESYGGSVFAAVEGGMSLRDWFAGQALAGIYASRDLQLCTLADMSAIGAGGFEVCMAKQAYRQADAMLAARGGSNDTE